MPQFDFRLYRINIVDDMSTLFNANHSRIRSDDDITNLCRLACDSEYDIIKRQKKHTYKWVLRRFNTLDASTFTNNRRLISFVAARATLSQTGAVLNDDDIQLAGEALAEPPPVEPYAIVFDLTRHLAAVETNSAVHYSNTWLDRLHTSLRTAARSLDYSSSLILEPVPSDTEIIDTFKRFDTLTKVSVTLRIPNPDLTRHTRRLSEQMSGGNIRELSARIYNEDGLSQDEEQLPFAAAAMAQQGYKKGDVKLSGLIDAVKRTVVVGKKAAAGAIDRFDGFIRGRGINTDSEEEQAMAKSLVEEIDQVLPPDNID